MRAHTRRNERNFAVGAGRGNGGGDQRSVGGIRKIAGLRAGVGFHRRDGGWGEGSEVEDAPNPPCRGGCFPDRKCSQPKYPPARLLPEVPARRVPSAKSGRLRSGRLRLRAVPLRGQGDRLRTIRSEGRETTSQGRQFEWPLPFPPGGIVPVYSCSGGRQCVTLRSKMSAFCLRKRWAGAGSDRLPIETTDKASRTVRFQALPVRPESLPF